MPYFDRTDPDRGNGPSPYPGTFLLNFRQMAEGLGWKILRWQGSAVICTDSQGEERVLGLENLYRRARKHDREEWPGIILDFLQRIGEGSFDHLPDNLNAVTERVRVRVGPPIHIQSDKDSNDQISVWFQPLVGSDFGMHLVVDYPQSIAFVTDQMIQDSGIASEEWVQRGIKNLQEITPGDCLEILDEASGLHYCCKGDAYDAARVLLLEQMIPDKLENGLFVAIPGRDQLFVLPVTAQGLASLPMLKMLAEKEYKTTPYAISPDIFWIFQNRWFAFGLNLEKERVVVTPPVEFQEILRRISPEMFPKENSEEQN